MPAPRLRKAVVAVAAMLIVAIVTTQRSATASRLSSDPTDVQDAETPQPQSGLRRLVSLMRGRRGDAVRDSANHRLLAQVAKPANASIPANASKPVVAASVAAKVPDPKVDPKPGKVVAPAKVDPKPAGKVVAPAKVNPKPAGKVVAPAKVDPKPTGKVVVPVKAAPKSTCIGRNQKLCNGMCVDITFDRNHCGACNKRCNRGQVCDAGRILQWPEDDEPCPVPYRSCNGQCCHTLADPDNCGFCGNTCGAGEQCDAGTCKKVKVPKEAPGKNTCNSRGRSCYYSFFDSNLNCGRCGITCPPDACCVRGQCQCRRKKCLCLVNGQLKCIKPGDVCPSTGKMCPKRCKTKWCGNECCSGPYDVCYDSNNDGSCDKCCPLSRWNQKILKCCPENTGPCNTDPSGCCPTCQGPLCGTNCCPVGAACYNDDGVAATSTKCCPKGSSVFPETDPEKPDLKQVCCPAGQTGYYDDKQQPACCITANYDATTSTCCDTALCSTADGNVCCAQLDGAPENSVCRPDGIAGGNLNVCCPLDFNVCGTQCCDPAASDPRNGACFTDPSTGIVGCPPVSFVCVDDPASPNYNCEDGPNGAQFQCCPNQLGVSECVQLGTEAHCSDCSACATGETCCSGACKNTKNDEANCGACGNACSEGQTCCNGVCTNTGGDGSNCGACGTACSEGETCCNGVCCTGSCLNGACCPTTPDTCPDGSQKCCGENEDCYADGSGTQLCCNTDNWDSNARLCCSEKLCEIKTLITKPPFFKIEKKCCPSDGATCGRGVLFGFDVCCPDDKWTGSACCTGDKKAATCPDNSKKCCPAGDYCYSDNGNNKCCKQERWNADTQTCCPDSQWNSDSRTCCGVGEKPCGSACIKQDQCCNSGDCECVVPQGLSKTAALMCTKPPCCIQKLCCGYSCIIPGDDNCAACGDKCPADKQCAGSTCVCKPLSYNCWADDCDRNSNHKCSCHNGNNHQCVSWTANCNAEKFVCAPGVAKDKCTRGPKKLCIFAPATGGFRSCCLGSVGTNNCGHNDESKCTEVVAAA